MRLIINLIKGKALLVLMMFSAIQIFGQVTPVTIIKNRPEVQEILTALQGQGLKIKMIRSTPSDVPPGKIQDYGFVAGFIDGTNAGKPEYGQVAIFKDGYKAGLGMDSGVLFSTGDATTDLMSHNLNTRQSIDYKYNYTDPDLVAIFREADFDTFVLEFDVELDENVSALRVAFQFGSEEYPDFVGSNYSDSFGFFVSGPGLNETINVAKNPTNQGNITVNEINGGIRGQYYRSGMPVDLTNSYHYINNGHTTIIDTVMSFHTQERLVSNNDFDLTSAYKPVYIEYNGITNLITYDLNNLIGGETYRFKLVIADASDGDYDSGVLIHKIHGTIGSDLTIKKEIDKKEPMVGEEVEFTLTAHNKGPYLAKDIIVTDILPSGYEFVSSEILNNSGTYDHITGLWEFNELAVALRPEFAPVLKIKARVKGDGDYTNTAYITVKEPTKYPDDFMDNNYSEVTPDVQKPAAIGLVKIGKVDDTVDGTHGNGVINYTFTITNEGDVPLKEINLEDFKIENQTSTIKPFIYVFEGDDNEDELLNVGEIWRTTATYHITDADTDAEKVENRATVYGKSPKDVEVSAHSKNEQGLDSSTITPVEGGGPLMTNPHIYHKVQ